MRLMNYMLSRFVSTGTLRIIDAPITGVPGRP
jgi:hypothetical protein